MKKLTILNGIIEIVVSAGAGAAVGNIIKSSVPLTATKLNRFTIGVGSIVLAGAAANFASNYAQEQVTNTVEQFVKMKAAAGFKDVKTADTSSDAPESNDN